MPSENKCNLSLNDSSCDTTTATSGLISTCDDTITTYNTTGNILVSNNTSTGIANFDWACASGTSSISSVISDFDPGYRSAKDGEVRIDPETGECLIFLSEYGEWAECDVEFKKIKDENGNNKNIISATFNISVSRLKSKQKERMVLTEKVKKYKLIDFTSGYLHVTGNIGLGITTPYNTLTIGTDPYYLTTGSNNTSIGQISYTNATTFLNGTNTITLF